MRMDERGMRGSRGGRTGRAAMMLWALCLSLAAGCFQQQDPNEVVEPPEPTYLVVENRAFLDMTIYVYRSSQRLRLGQATGSSTSKFKIPSSFMFGMSTLRFQADPIGGNRSPISQEITVVPGDQVYLVIPPN